MHLQKYVGDDGTTDIQVMAEDKNLRIFLCIGKEVLT